MYIDLSICMRDQMPVYPGDPAVEIKVAAVFETEGYDGHDLRFGNHAGTHIDAAAHMIEGGKTLNQYPLKQFFGRCRYIEYEQTLDPAKFDRLDIGAGEMVIVNTGMAKKFESPAYFTDYPVISTEFAHYVVNKNIHMIGIDTCSIDNAENFPVHKILLASGILIAENLTNVHMLKNKTATIYALPLSTALDAAPARIVAKVLE